jgi:hypothetical protein
MPFEGAEVAYLHPARPTLLVGGPIADFTGDDKLRQRVAVEPEGLELVQEFVFSSLSLSSSAGQIINFVQSDNTNNIPC